MGGRQAISADSSALLSLHAAYHDRYPALFESSAGGNAATRFDILFAHPQAQLTLTRDRSLIGAGAKADERFLPALDRWFQQERTAPTASEIGRRRTESLTCFAVSLACLASVQIWRRVG